MTDKIEELIERLQRRELHFRNAVEGEYDADLLRKARFEIAALRTQRDEVIEECARVADDHIATVLAGVLDDVERWGREESAVSIATAIRELKSEG